MIELNKLYQTVSDRNNPDEVEERGPFPSKYRPEDPHSRPWLGNGYYFWDNLIRRAHWWGEKHCNNSYIICEACANIEEGKYWDLAGNMEHLHEFEACYMAICEKFKLKSCTVSFVIAKLQKDNLFSYQAMRVLSEFCGGDNQVRFVDWNKSFLNFSPPMQICLYSKQNITKYHIVYPQEYVFDSVV